MSDAAISPLAQEVAVTLIAIENGDGKPSIAWASVAVSIAGVDVVLHGVSIVRDGRELVCRTPHHRRGGKSLPSVEVPRKIADAVAEIVFGAYNSGLAVPQLPKAARPLARAVH
jgi:hypothetical protein